MDYLKKWILGFFTELKMFLEEAIQRLGGKSQGVAVKMKTI